VDGAVTGEGGCSPRSHQARGARIDTTQAPDRENGRPSRVERPRPDVVAVSAVQRLRSVVASGRAHADRRQAVAPQAAKARVRVGDAKLSSRRPLAPGQRPVGNRLPLAWTRTADPPATLVPRISLPESNQRIGRGNWMPWQASRCTWSPLDCCELRKEWRWPRSSACSITREA